MATLKALYSAVYTTLTNANISTYFAEHLSVDSNGNLVPPQDSAYIVVSLVTDEAATDFDNEAFGAVTVQLAAWATDAEAALDVLHSALTALAPAWERRTTAFLGRDTGYVGYVARIQQVR